MSAPITPTTELEAVNVILSTIGEAPVNSLAGQTTTDAALAITKLAEISKSVQGRGWNFNTDLGYPLTRDVNGEIPLPANLARVEIDKCKHPLVKAVVRGTRLYDRLNRTFKWTQDLTADKLVTFLPFTDLPEIARRYITIRSARIFQDQVLGAESLHAYTAQDEADSFFNLRRDCLEIEDINMLDNADVRNVTWRPNTSWR